MNKKKQYLKRGGIFVFILCLCLSIPYLFTIGKNETHSGIKKVVIFAIDGFGYQYLQNVLRYQKENIPTIHKMLQDGAKLSKIKPIKDLDMSPAIWTSYFTGKLPQTHGVQHFLFSGEEANKKVLRLYNSSDVRAQFIWQELSDKGKSIGLVGLYCTYPALKLKRGFVISDRFLLYDEILLGIIRDAASYFTSDSRASEYTIRPENVSVSPQNLFAKLSEDCNVSIELFYDAYSKKLVEFFYYRYIPKRLKQKSICRLLNTQLYIYKLVQNNELPDLYIHYFFENDSLNHFSLQDFVANKDIKDTPEKRYVLSAGQKGFSELHRDVLRYYDRVVKFHVQNADPNTLFIILSDHGIHLPNIVKHRLPLQFNTPFLFLYQKGVSKYNIPDEVDALSIYNLIKNASLSEKISIQ